MLNRLLEHCMKADNRRFLLGVHQQELLDLTVMLEKVLRHGFKGVKNEAKRFDSNF